MKKKNIRWKVCKTIKIWGTNRSWSFEKGSYHQSIMTIVEILLEGNTKDGYFLIKSPKGFFTADEHYDTFDEVMDSANEYFGIKEKDWNKT